MQEPQIIFDETQTPIFAVILYKDYLALRGLNEVNTVPHKVAEKVLIEEKSLLQSWREYLEFTQKEIANKLGISQSAYAQMEKPERNLRKSTRIRLAKALGINELQLTYED